MPGRNSPDGLRFLRTLTKTKAWWCAVVPNEGSLSTDSFRHVPLLRIIVRTFFKRFD